MKTELKDVIHFYIGCEAIADETRFKIHGVEFMDAGTFINSESTECWRMESCDFKLILRPLSDLSNWDLTMVGTMICAIPNHESKDFEWVENRTSNTVGIHYTSKHFNSLNYFSIYTEKDKNPGHIEVGWFVGMDKRKKELWKVGGFHNVTVYLLKNGFDVFGLIENGYAIDKTKIK